MKRSAALTPLSHDHQHGLAVALLMARATPDSASEARTEFLGFWRSEGEPHFKAEEAELLPALAGRLPPDHESIVRVLVDHVELRRRAADLARDPSPAVESLHELGSRLRDHIRYEERVVFPLAEETLDEAALAALGRALADQAHG